MKSILKLFAFCDKLECVPTNLPVTQSALGGPNESPPELSTYKQEEDYLCFDCYFDNNDNDADDVDNDYIPTTSPTTAADLLLTVINQIPPIPSPSPSPSSPFIFSYSEVTPPQTTNDSSTNSAIFTPSRSVPTIKTTPCYASGTVILSTSPLERITS